MKITVSFFFMILFFLSHGIKSQDNIKGLELIFKGDSLFSKKKYIEAGALYEKVFKDYDYYTPQMLLKMSFVNEGLHNYAAALYYLSIYRKFFPDLTVEEKIIKMAQEKSIPGYAVNFYSTLRFFLSNFYREVIWGTLGISLLWFLNLLYLYVKKKTFPFVKTAFFMAYLVFSGCLLNYERFLKSEAIIFEHQPLVMNAPSAGASLISQPVKGTKVVILQKKDIWTEIEMDGQKAFVRSMTLKEI